MAFIVQRLTDNRLNLGREELIRPMPWGSHWQAVRIAALVQVNVASSFSSPYGFPMIALGLATGNSGVLVDNTVDVIGCAPNFSSTTWTFGVNSGTYTVYAPTAGATSFQKIGSTFTTATAGVTYPYIGALAQAGNSVLNRLPIVVDIVKNTYVNGLAVPYTFTLWSGSAVANWADTTPSVFFTGIQSLSAPAGAGAALTSDGAPALTPAGNMLHNSAWLMWNRMQPTLDVSEFVAIRFA